MWSRIVRWSIAIILAPMAFVIPVFGSFLTLLGCILVAPDIAGWFSGSLNGLLWTSHHTPPGPVYGIPESLVARGQYEEAERAYEEIIRKYPDEVKPHVDLINIAVTRLHNLELATQLYQRGMTTLRNQEAKCILTNMHAAIRSRLESQVRSPEPIHAEDQMAEIKSHLNLGRHGMARDHNPHEKPAADSQDAERG
jgi:tetratricopeptide (TPR) repeat protein